MKINLLSFATSNWINARNRITSQANVLSKKYEIFKTVTFLTEKDLDEDYFKHFKKYVNDPGFAYWSWKPYIIYKYLEKLNDNEILMYIDGGCYLENNVLIVDRLRYISDNLYKYEFPIAVGQTQNIDPIILQVRKSVLEKFGLVDNFNFLLQFPHYEAGMQIILNKEITRTFYRRWYEFMRDYYEDSIHSERYDKTGQYQQYWRNGGDQQVFQCMLYKQNKHFCDLWNFWYKYGICRRIIG